LENLRKSLASRRGDAFPARSLSIRLAWSESRWWEIEQKETWKPDMQAQVISGVIEILCLTDASQETVAAWLSYLTRESDALPAVDIAWLDGVGPVQPQGRPVGSRKGPDGRMVRPEAGSAPVTPQAAFPITAELVEAFRSVEAAGALAIAKAQDSEVALTLMRALRRLSEMMKASEQFIPKAA
jgi:hypothetical protein